MVCLKSQEKCTENTLHKQDNVLATTAGLLKSQLDEKGNCHDRKHTMALCQQSPPHGSLLHGVCFRSCRISFR